MDLEVFHSLDHFEEEEANPTITVEAQLEVPKESSPLNVVAGALSEQTP